MSQSDLLKRMAEYLGSAKFNKLIRSADTARQKGRLVFWQEALLDQFTADTGQQLPPDFEGIVALLDSAEPIPISATREQFFENPVAVWTRPDVQIPFEWLVEAAQEVHFREHLAYSLARSASKVGDFDLVSEEALSILRAALSEPQLLDLYVYIREVSKRLEEEWKDEFEFIFGYVIDDESLPEKSEMLH